MFLMYKLLNLHNYCNIFIFKTLIFKTLNIKTILLKIRDIIIMMFYILKQYIKTDLSIFIKLHCHFISDIVTYVMIILVYF